MATGVLRFCKAVSVGVNSMILLYEFHTRSTRPTLSIKSTRVNGLLDTHTLLPGVHTSIALLFVNHSEALIRALSKTRSLPGALFDNPKNWTRQHIGGTTNSSVAFRLRATSADMSREHSIPRKIRAGQVKDIWDQTHTHTDRYRLE